MGHFRIALLIALLGPGRANAQAPAPPVPLAQVGAQKPPRLLAKSATEIVEEGLPAVSPDAKSIAFVRRDMGYDESATETLIIQNIDSGRREKALPLGKTLAGGETRGSLKQVRTAVNAANQLVKAFRTLPPCTEERSAKPAGTASGDSGSPSFRFAQGSRRLVYSSRSGRVELTDGKILVYRGALKASREWMCCHKAAASEGGCKRSPEWMGQVFGDDKLLFLHVGFSSGPDGCETENEWQRIRLPASPTPAPPPAPTKP